MGEKGESCTPSETGGRGWTLLRHTVPSPWCRGLTGGPWGRRDVKGTPDGRHVSRTVCCYPKGNRRYLLSEFRTRPTDKVKDQSGSSSVRHENPLVLFGVIRSGTWGRDRPGSRRRRDPLPRGRTGADVWLVDLSPVWEGVPHK